MFDFERWRRWLQQRALEMTEGHAEFQLSKPSSKPSMAFNLTTDTALGQLRIWQTGEADYDIMDQRNNKFARHVSEMRLDDNTFESAFAIFLNHVNEVR